MHAPLSHAPHNPEHDDTWYRAVLHDLTARGNDLAYRIHEGATATPTPQNHPETQFPTPQPANTNTPITPEQGEAAGKAALPFERAVGTVRRTIALARHIAIHPIAAARDQAANLNPATPKKTRQRHSPARARLTRAVEAAVERSRHGEGESFLPLLYERLEDAEFDFGVDGRDLDEVIAEICQELGIEMPHRTYVWKQRSERDLAPPAPRALNPRPNQGPNPHRDLRLVQGGAPRTPDARKPQA